jgi:hypothetical protein
VFLLAFFLSQNVYSQDQGQEQLSFSVYENPALGIAIQYPSKWQIIEHQEGDGVRFQISPLAAFDIIVQPSMVLLPLEDQSKLVIRQYGQNLRDFQLVNSEPVRLKNNTAQILEFSYTNDKYGKIGGMDIVMMSNESIYIMKYRTQFSQYNDYLPAIVNMIDSFQASPPWESFSQ